MYNKTDIRMDVQSSRRRFIKCGVNVTASLIIPNAFAGILAQPERKLSLLNLHTGEKINTTYWANGQYQLSELKAINHILRDHRTGDVNNIDHNLIDLLTVLHQKMNGQHPFHVISGYRSPKSNAILSASSTGVAKKSLHMQGKAIDIRLPGRQLSALRTTACKLHSGGVGYYPKSDFIHVDTGHVRQWG
jgi:uncharacterized protein YcbK (DUF882 family)